MPSKYRVYIRNLGPEVHEGILFPAILEKMKIDCEDITNMHVMQPKYTWGNKLKSAFVTFQTTELRNGCCVTLDGQYCEKLGCATLFLFTLVGSLLFSAVPNHYYIISISMHVQGNLELQAML